MLKNDLMLNKKKYIFYELMCINHFNTFLYFLIEK